MKRNQPGSALLLLLVFGLAIIALIMFTKGGLWERLYSPATQPGTGGVKARMTDMEEKVNAHNAAADAEINPEAVNAGSAIDKAQGLIDSQQENSLEE
jgi:hypothetical protein